MMHFAPSPVGYRGNRVSVQVALRSGPWSVNISLRKPDRVSVQIRRRTDERRDLPQGPQGGADLSPRALRLRDTARLRRRLLPERLGAALLPALVSDRLHGHRLLSDARAHHAAAAEGHERRGALVEPDTDELRHSRLFLRDAVEGLRGLHRPLVVCDEDELRLLGKFHQERREAVDVRFVERGVDLVEDAERRGLVLEDRDEKRDGRERLLAAREEADRLVPLAGRLRHDLESRVERIVLVEKVHRGRAAVEETLEDLAEVEIDGGEGFLKALRRGQVDRLDRLEDLGERRLEVGLLAGQLREALAFGFVFLERRVIDGAEALEREGAGRDVLGESGLEGPLGHLQIGLAALHGRKLARQAAELVPALLEEVILVGLVPFEGELDRKSVV